MGLLWSRVRSFGAHTRTSQARLLLRGRGETLPRMEIKLSGLSLGMRFGVLTLPLNLWFQSSSFVPLKTWHNQKRSYRLFGIAHSASAEPSSTEHGEEDWCAKNKRKGRGLRARGCREPHLLRSQRHSSRCLELRT